jgi:hypothetical protein
METMCKKSVSKAISAPYMIIAPDKENNGGFLFELIFIMNFLVI